MTEVEFSRLLSDLSETAAKLNKASDSVNEIITRFQDTLRTSNLGLEAWPTSLDSEAWMEEHDAEECERGEIRTELGFTKLHGEWVLATRQAFYDHGDTGFANVWEFVRADEPHPLLDAPRQMRLEALKYFPKLAQGLTKVAEEALKAIEDAKKFVK